MDNLDLETIKGNIINLVDSLQERNGKTMDELKLENVQIEKQLQMEQLRSSAEKKKSEKAVQAMKVFFDCLKNTNQGIKDKFTEIEKEIIAIHREETDKITRLEQVTVSMKSDQIDTLQNEITSLRKELSKVQKEHGTKEGNEQYLETIIGDLRIENERLVSKQKYLTIQHQQQQSAWKKKKQYLESKIVKYTKIIKDQEQELGEVTEKALSQQVMMGSETVIGRLKSHISSLGDRLNALDKIGKGPTSQETQLEVEELKMETKSWMNELCQLEEQWGEEEKSMCRIVEDILKESEIKTSIEWDNKLNSFPSRQLTESIDSQR